jgi:hypothetical protein
MSVFKSAFYSKKKHLNRSCEEWKRTILVKPYSWIRVSSSSSTFSLLLNNPSILPWGFECMQDNFRIGIRVGARNWSIGKESKHETYLIKLLKDWRKRWSHCMLILVKDWNWHGDCVEAAWERRAEAKSCDWLWMSGKIEQWLIWFSIYNHQGMWFT